MGRRRSITVELSAAPDAVFAHLDDQTRLAAHMAKPSMMMGGGRMSYEFDAGRGQVVGSHIRMEGSAFGLRLLVDEVVTGREPPHTKRWETTGRSRLVILSGYRMGFDIVGEAAPCRLTVWIDYDWPSGPAKLLAIVFAPAYARWCIGRMASDAAAQFNGSAKAQGPSRRDAVHSEGR